MKSRLKLSSRALSPTQNLAINKVFIHVNGLRYPWDYAKLLWHMRRPTESLTIKSVLVEPEYWNAGVSVLLFAEMARRAWDQGLPLVGPVPDL